jgi:UDP:flavonoid glycosyltransferase YjiC (YdhE family)
MSGANATILFVMHPERGHVSPTLKIVKELQTRGHRVCVTGTPDVERHLPPGLLEFTPLFPRGLPAAPSAGPEVLRGLLAQKFRSVVGRVRPGLVVTDCTVLSLRDLDNAFVVGAVKDYGVKSMLLSTSLPNRTRFGWPDNHDPVLILCPREFDFPTETKPEHVYAEASIDLEREEPDFPWERLRPGKRLLYCSLGSESRRYDSGGRFLQNVIEAAASRPDWQLVLSTGTHLRPGDFERVPPDAVLVSVAPQLKLLGMASLMITHGGLGTLKECIYFGVPMIVFPMSRDQPDNAARVVYHRLGLSGSVGNSTPEKLAGMIDKVESSPIYRASVSAMGEVFRECERSGGAVKVIEEFCSSPAPATP